MRPINRIIVHHTAGPDSQSVAQIRAYHVAAAAQGGRGWSDIGYHYLVRRAGKVWLVEVGRPVELIGAHDVGQNTGSIGVALAGDYSRGPVQPAAWRVLVDLVCQLMELYGLQPAQVEGHGENEPASTPTLCPGFDPEELRRSLSPSTPPAVPTPEAGA